MRERIIKSGNAINPTNAETKGKGQKRDRSFLEYVLLSVKGFCMGASDVVPGVSGGTMAFILGIYEELIEAIKSFDLKSLQLLGSLKVGLFFDRVSWRFLLALGAGILTAIFSLARLLSWLLQNRPVLIWSFFFGLVLASAITISRRVDWRASIFFWMLGGALGAYVLVGLVPVFTPNTPWFLFLSGSVAICAMILPGISGSFVLVLLGKYQYVLDAVNRRDLFVLALFSAGACVGIMAFSRLLGWLLRRCHNQMVAILTGLMLGSLRKVWPWKETLKSLRDPHGQVIPVVQENVLPAHWDGEVLGAIMLMLAGFLVVLLLDHLAGPSPSDLSQAGEPKK